MHYLLSDLSLLLFLALSILDRNRSHSFVHYCYLLFTVIILSIYLLFSSFVSRFSYCIYLTICCSLHYLVFNPILSMSPFEPFFTGAILFISVFVLNHLSPPWADDLLSFPLTGAISYPFLASYGSSLFLVPRFTLLSHPYPYPFLTRVLDHVLTLDVALHPLLCYHVSLSTFDKPFTTPI